MPQQFSPTTLLLVRHGQARSSDGSYGPETPLDKLGRAQAKAVATALLARTPPSVVYTSPWPRAIDTAAPLCEKLGVHAIVDGRLAEFTLGISTLEAIQQRPDLAIWQSDHRGPAAGETLGEFSFRVGAFFNDIVSKHQDERVAVFVHSGVIDAVIRWALGFPHESVWQHEFDLPNGSITEIEFWPNGRVQEGSPRYAIIRRVGDARHLENLTSVSDT